MIKQLFAFTLACAFATTAYADPLITCSGQYALCASSSTTPTGKTIVINGVTFQEGVSVCPVLTGESVGDAALIGTCAPPLGDRTVWSLFSLETEYPQAPTWEVQPAVARTFVTTAISGMSNMWSFECVKTKKVNGVQLADCFGPLNESPFDGGHVKAGSTVVTQAPVGASFPVGGNLP